MDPITLESLIEAGGIAYVSYLREHGSSPSQAFARVMERWPLAPTQSAWALVNRAAESFYKANRYDESKDPNFRLAASDLASRPGATGWRWHGMVRFTDPATGTVTERSFSFTSPKNLTNSEIREALEKAARDYYDAGLLKPGSKEPESVATAEAYNLYSVERWRV